MRWRYTLLAFVLLLGATTHALGAPLWLYSVHTQEELRIPSLRPSRISKRSWRLANHFFRSRKTLQRRTVHPRLLRTLAHIQRHFDNRRIEVVSGYRTPVAGDVLNSYHQVGRAADIRIVGVPKATLFAYCRTLPHMGCGYYPRAEFVHIDVRSKAAIWVDRSPPGSPRDYVANPRAWLRSHGI